MTENEAIGEIRALLDDPNIVHLVAAGEIVERFISTPELAQIMSRRILDVWKRLFCVSDRFVAEAVRDLWVIIVWAAMTPEQVYSWKCASPGWAWIDVDLSRWTEVDND